MFWKRIQKPKTEASDSGRPLFERPRERRKTYRVRPAADAPVVVEIAGWVLHAQNISVGGLALQLPESAEFDEVVATVTLPDGPPPFQVVLRGLVKERSGLQHCAFVHLDPELEEKLFEYVLRRDQELISDHPAPIE